MLTRRAALVSGAATLGACALLPSSGNGGRLSERRIGNREITLTAREAKVALGREPAPLWLYDDWPFPVLRMTHGESLSVTLNNALREHTSIHWHGVRVPNAMDGVPYLTQTPVQPGERFTYRFTPPDAGTYFFHPHCNTVEQLGRGLLGALIVEDPPEHYGDDVVLILKDWRLDEHGRFLPFLTDKGAAQAGSFGTLRTVNGRVQPAIDLAARSNVRLRMINADPTRIAEIGIDGGAARVIAVDGNSVAPFALETWKLGPGMRLDVIFDGDKARLLDYFAAEPVVLAELSAPPVAGRGSPVYTVPPPDFSDAWHHTLELGAGVAAADLPNPQPIVLPDGRRIELADSLCLAQGAFWTLDGKSWPGRDHARLPPPLFTLARGQKVVLDIANTTSRSHPIHIHGHTMTVLSASVLKRPIHRADTVLVLPNERVTVGFVADNPGNWMVHCHVVEHQETGMMGWFRVS
ncbi:MAG: multicopper oxidase family protein [Alphaproteobacteria bacterium]|nr:multicopper oxidase family protein [Alphaproteobacteria bacterium]